LQEQDLSKHHMYLLLLLCVGTCAGKMWLVETKGNNTEASRHEKEAGQEYSENENNLEYDTNQEYEDYIRYGDNQEYEDYQNDDGSGVSSVRGDIQADNNPPGPQADTNPSGVPENTTPTVTQEVTNAAGPTLEEIKAKVCNVHEAGTNDYVYVRFRNGKKETCTTDNLDKHGDDWTQGSVNIFGANWFSDCKSGQFKCCLNMTPSDGLDVKVEHSKYVLTDLIRICRVEAKFSNNQLWRFVSAKEKGEQSNHYSNQRQRTQTEWLKMCRVCRSPEEDEKKHCCSNE